MALQARNYKRSVLQLPIKNTETLNTWVIPNFRNLITSTKRVEVNPGFTKPKLIGVSETIPCTILRIETYFSLTFVEDNVHVNAYVRRPRDSRTYLPPVVRYHLVVHHQDDAYGDKTLLCELDVDCTATKRDMRQFSPAVFPCPSVTGAFIGTRWLFTRERALELAPRAELTVQVRASLPDGEGCEQYARHVDELDERLCSDMEHLFCTDDHSDLVIRAGDGCHFRAHKAVLCARSYYFAVMFSYDGFDECHTGYVFIKEFDGPTVCEMLRFLYCGQIARIDETADLLIAAADKYGISQLRDCCEYALVERISPSNVLDVVQLASCANAEVLLDAALAFVAYHAGQLRKQLAEVKKRVRQFLPGNRAESVLEHVTERLRQWNGCEDEQYSAMSEQERLKFKEMYPKGWNRISPFQRNE